MEVNRTTTRRCGAEAVMAKREVSSRRQQAIPRRTGGGFACNEHWEHGLPHASEVVDMKTATGGCGGAWY